MYGEGLLLHYTEKHTSVLLKLAFYDGLPERKYESLAKTYLTNSNNWW